MEGGSPNTVTRSKWQTVKVLVQEPGDLNSNPNFVIKNILKNMVLFIYMYRKSKPKDHLLLLACFSFD